MRQWVCALTVHLFALLALALGIILVKSVSWRVWEFDSQVVPVAFIGLWDAQYYVRRNESGLVFDMLIDYSIHRGWTLATELEYAKDIMVLVNFMQAMAVILNTAALLLSRLKPTYPDFVRFYYRLSALLLFLNSGCVALAVSWNYAMDISGQSTLDFPADFPVGKEAVTEKHVSYVFPLGIVTATLSLLGGVLCFGAMSLPKPNAVAPAGVP